MHSSHRISPRLDHWRRDGCVSCDEATPQCNCAAGEKCILTSRTCNQCPTIQCLKTPGSKSKGVNPGAIAGPVVAVLIIASLGLFWWLRRKKRRDLARLEALAARARKAESAGFQLSHPPSPQPESVHSSNSQSASLPKRPPSAARSRSPLPPAPVNAEYYDDHGATIRVYDGSRGTIHLNDKSQNDNGDPFSDRQSISTMGSGGTANIIPIQYIPPSKSDEALSRILVPGQGPTSQYQPQGQASQSAAAKALDIARQNLLHHPKRPARAPDLDLRLNPPTQTKDGLSIPPPPSAYSFLNDQRSPGGSGSGSGNSSQYRDSYLSGNSAAPSYWSGQSDVHLDAPKIVTSKQVQIGRLQQAEVVQFGKPQQSMERLGGGTGNGVGNGQTSPTNNINLQTQQQSALSPTNGSFHFGDPSVRTLTPISNRYTVGEEEEEEGLRSAEPSSAGSGDLRFSMGSLAYDRNSVSTMGTGRYLASAISTGTPNNLSNSNLPLPPPPPPNVSANHQQRDSNLSSKSFADSVLGSFPMIPPSPSHFENRPGPTGLPQSTSTNTLEHLSISRPPTMNYNNNTKSFTSPAKSSNGGRIRPETQASVADSFLGSFPFVPPDREDLADLPISNAPSNPRGVSTTSEGLGGFDFKLDEDVPPVPTQPRN